MKTILAILLKAGGWHPGLYLKIVNAPHMELVIDAMEELGPCGLPALSVAHYGDALCQPEMYFEVSMAGGANLNPFYYRNDYEGVDQWSRFVAKGHYIHIPDLHRRHERFAAQWEKNLHAQRFLEAFTSTLTR